MRRRTAMRFFPSPSLPGSGAPGPVPRARRRVRPGAAALALLSAATLLGPPATALPFSTAGTTAASAGAPKAPAGSPVLIVESGGGFVPVEFFFRSLPRVYVTADWRLITEGPQIAIFPGPALPNLRQRTVTARGQRAFAARVAAAGLAAPAPDYGQITDVADAPQTTVTVVIGGRRYVHSVYALTESSTGLTPAQAAARKNLRTFIDGLSDPAFFGAGGLGPETALVPAAFRVRASPVPADAARGGTGDLLPPQVRAWPLTSVDLRRAATCAPVTGSAARTLRAALATANTETRWTQRGTTYTVAIRPVLPGEPGCPAASG